MTKTIMKNMTKTNLIICLCLFLVLFTINANKYKLRFVLSSKEYNKCIDNETTCIITMYNTTNLTQDISIFNFSDVRQNARYMFFPSEMSEKYFPKYFPKYLQETSDIMITRQMVGYPEMNEKYFPKYFPTLPNTVQHMFKCCYYNGYVNSTDSVFIELYNEKMYYIDGIASSFVLMTIFYIMS